MLRTWIALECQGCGAQFPMSQSGVTQPADRAIETPAMLRREASKLGWQRYGGKDFCPFCETAHRTAAKKAGE